MNAMEIIKKSAGENSPLAKKIKKPGELGVQRGTQWAEGVALWQEAGVRSQARAKFSEHHQEQSQVLGARRNAQAPSRLLPKMREGEAENKRKRERKK